MSPIFAIGLILCILFCGLTIDIGHMELVKIQMQSAADGAAVGAELEAERTGPGANAGPFDWATHGQEDAAINGFKNGSNGATVTVIQNPTSGPYAGRYDAIQATVTQTVKTIFMGTLHGGTWTMTAQSVALVPPCSYFLGAYNSQYVNSFDDASATLFATCPVYSNYNFVVDGFSRGWGVGVDVSGTSGNSGGGGWFAQQTQGQGTGSSYGGAPPSVNPTFGVPVITDPLSSSVTQPTFGSCNFTSKTVTGLTVLNPGTYCGTSSTIGLTITNATVTLNPGLYVITGGAKINFSTITGTGVTLFFTKGNGASYGQFQVGNSPGGQSTLNLSAPTDTSNDGITGILFFADRNWVATGPNDFILNTNDTFSGDGIWYLPNTGLYVWANTWTVPNYGSFITRNTYFFATTITQNGNFSWLSGGSPFRTQSVLVQ
jgi:hypothetical protein